MDFRLAPLCGVTDWVFRTICAEMGCPVGYTEMVSAMGYLCAPDQRAQQELLIRGPAEKRLILQLFGKDPDTVAEAASRLMESGRFDGVDLNMGCPAHKIAPSGEGCGLMRSPETASEMMKKTVRAVSPWPVSVKMRLGWDAENINCIEIAKRAEDAGIAEITVHGRTRVQQYSGMADWDRIAEVKQRVSVPVIGNGDLFDAVTAIRRMEETGVDGVMIARGAMGNPWIFRDLAEWNAAETGDGRKTPMVTPAERLKTVLRHYDLLLSWKPERIAVREMRKHIGWYLHGLRGASSMRVALNRAETSAEAKELVSSFLESLSEVGLS